MKRLLLGALLALTLSLALAHGHDDEDEKPMMMDHSHLQGLMPTVNSLDEIITTWTRPRKETFVYTWENSEHGCEKGGDRNDHHCDDHLTYMATLKDLLEAMSLDELNVKVEEIYKEMVKHANMAAKSMAESFKKMVTNKEMRESIQEIAADRAGKNGWSKQQHENEIMKNLLKDHIEGDLSHEPKYKLNYTKIYNSLPETEKYRTTGQTPVAKEHLTKFLDVINDERYDALKQSSAEILQAAAADMKRHALRYNRFATAFEEHGHK